jgi:hypothetical protein
MISVSRIQSTLQFLNDPLFQIKDLTRIIASYAISFPEKVVKEVDSKYPHEIRLVDGILVVNSRMGFFEQFDLSSLMKITKGQHTAFQNYPYQVVYGFDAYKTKTIFSGTFGLHVLDDGITIDQTIFKETIFDVVIDSKNNSYYAITRGNMYCWNLKTNQLQAKYQLGDDENREICLCDGLLMIQSTSKVFVYEVPSLQLKFEIQYKPEGRGTNALCVSKELNCIIVAFDNVVSFYTLTETHEMIHQIFSERLITGLAYHPETGFLVASTAHNNSLVVFG